MIVCEESLGFGHFSDKRNILKTSLPVPGYSDDHFSHYFWDILQIKGVRVCRNLGQKWNTTFIIMSSQVCYQLKHAALTLL